MSAGNICVIGNNTADLVFTHSQKLDWGEKQNADAFAVFPGGQAANTAFTLAALGMPTSYVGYFGDDDYGKMSRSSLENGGVNVRYSLIVANCSNHIAAVFVDTARHIRTIMMFKPPKLTAQSIVIPQTDIQNFSAIYNDGHEVELSKEVSKAARQLGIPVVTDVERVSQDLLGLIRDSSIVMAPLSVLKEIADETDQNKSLEKVAGLGPSIVLATKGSEGSACYESGVGIVEAPAEPCNPIDTTGAGDAFHAGFLAARLRGLDIPSSLQEATKIAAMTCDCLGPRVSGTHLDSIRKGTFRSSPSP